LPRSTKSLNGSLGQTSIFLLEIAHAKLVGAPGSHPPAGHPRTPWGGNRCDVYRRFNSSQTTPARGGESLPTGEGSPRVVARHAVVRRARRRGTSSPRHTAGIAACLSTWCLSLTCCLSPTCCLGRRAAASGRCNLAPPGTQSLLGALSCAQLGWTPRPPFPVHPACRTTQPRRSSTSSGLFFSTAPW
jgi:hypothetical protein